MRKGGFHYGYLIALTCCALAFSAVGIVYSGAGVFYTPVSQALGVGKGTFTLYLTIQGLVMSFSLPIAGKLIATKDSRLVLSVASAVAAAIYIFIYANATSVYWFYAGGAIMGCCMGIILILMTPTLINFWFKEKVGLFMGVCLMFTGVGGVVFNPVGAYLIQTYGWNKAYMILGVVMAVICLPFTIFVVRRTPAEKGLLKFGETAEAIASAKTATSGAAAPLSGYTAAAAKKTLPFYTTILLAIGLGLAAPQIQFFPSYAVSIGLGVGLGASMASMGMLGNMIGKIIIGFLNDISLKLSLAVGVACGVVGMFTVANFNTVTALLLGGAFLHGIMYATTVTIPPMVTREVFGQREYAQIYSQIAMIAGIVGAFALSAWGFVADFFSGSFVPGFYMTIGLLVFALLVGIISLQRGKQLPTM